MNNTWQPIETAEQNEYKKVLVYTALRDTYVARWNDLCQCFVAETGMIPFTISATHWMPLPEPPTENNND